MDIKKISIGRKIIAFFILFSFLITSTINQAPYVFAQSFNELPKINQLVTLSQSFNPPLLIGLKIFPDNPFKLNFILNKGDFLDSNENLKIESSKLIKYFLAALTVPEKDFWVNLSPYEKDRIIPEEFGKTEMGRDLLSQDYILKQITASLMYPENETGKEFWDKIYDEALKLYGTTDIPLDSFNKVWIVPDKAVVFESKEAAFVVESHLKVMLETDYEAMSNQKDLAESRAPASDFAMRNSKKEVQNSDTSITSDIIKQIIIPAIEREANEGKNFTQLRQVYNSLILAVWFKDKIKESIFGKAYVDKGKTAGVDIEDKLEKEKIWGKYVEAFKKGIYEYIKEDYDPDTQSIIPRKYFLGGAGMDQIRNVHTVTTDFSRLPNEVLGGAMIVESNLYLADEINSEISLSNFERGLLDKIRQEGPLPNLEFPEKNKVREVFLKFNSSEELTDDDLELLIKQAVAENRNFLIDFREMVLRKEYPILSNGDKILRLSADVLTDACTIASRDIRWRLFSMTNKKVDIFHVQAYDVFNFENDHTFVVVKLKEGQKYFLIDTTFRQFFNKVEGKSGHPIGEYFEKNNSEFAKKLLENGYCEFDDLKASEYGNAFNLTTREIEINVDKILQKGWKGIEKYLLRFFTEDKYFDLFGKHEINTKERIESIRQAAVEAGFISDKAMVVDTQAAKEILIKFLVLKSNLNINESEIEVLGQGGNSVILGYEDSAFRISESPHYPKKYKKFSDNNFNIVPKFKHHNVIKGADGKTYRIMEVEKIYGESIDKKNILTDQEIRMARELFDKLISNGIYVNDLKPSNVMIGQIRRDGVFIPAQAYLIDAEFAETITDLDEAAKSILRNVEIYGFKQEKWSSHDPENKISLYLRQKWFKGREHELEEKIVLSPGNIKEAAGLIKFLKTKGNEPRKVLLVFGNNQSDIEEYKLLVESVLETWRDDLKEIFIVSDFKILETPDSRIKTGFINDVKNLNDFDLIFKAGTKEMNLEIENSPFIDYDYFLSFSFYAGLSFKSGIQEFNKLIGLENEEEFKKGGIDLTRDKINIETQNVSGDVNFKFDPKIIDRLQSAPGLMPAVIDIYPMTISIPMFLGIKKEKSEFFLSQN